MTQKSKPPISKTNRRGAIVAHAGAALFACIAWAAPSHAAVIDFAGLTGPQVQGVGAISGFNDDAAASSSSADKAAPSGTRLPVAAPPGAIPEPGTCALIGLGLALIGWLGRRRRKR